MSVTFQYLLNPSAPLSSLSIRFALPIPSRGHHPRFSSLAAVTTPKSETPPLLRLAPLPLEIFPSQWYKVSPPPPPSILPMLLLEPTTIQKGSSKQMREGKERCVCVLYHPRLLHVCRVSCFRSVFFLFWIYHIEKFDRIKKRISRVIVDQGDP